MPYISSQPTHLSHYIRKDSRNAPVQLWWQNYGFTLSTATPSEIPGKQAHSGCLDLLIKHFYSFSSDHIQAFNNSNRKHPVVFLRFRFLNPKGFWLTIPVTDCVCHSNHGLGASVLFTGSLRHIHFHIGVRWIEPACFLSLLSLLQYSQRKMWSVIVVEREPSYCRRNLHFALVSRFLPHDGVSVRVACSITLKELKWYIIKK